MKNVIRKLKRIKKAIQNGLFFDRIGRRLIKFNRNRYMRHIKIKKNKVIFFAFQGRYECNPKWVCEALLKTKKYELTWVCKEKDLNDLDQYPKGLKIVKYYTKECYEEMASARVIVTNGMDIANLKYKKRKGQILIQTWHGSMGFKRLGTDSRPSWLRKVKRLGKITDYITCNSKFEEDLYRETYWPETELLKIGHPRNDILFDKTVSKKLSTHIKKKYSIDLDSKIALYAPTYRDDYKIEHYDMDYKKLRESLEKRFGGKWTILIRFHYKVFRELDTDKLTKNAVNVSDYPDMQEILSITDVGITDYSSWMCDYVLTRKPGFIYASDLDEYDNERGFYYSLHTTPFKVCENTNELCKAIEKFDDKVYQKGVDKFLKDRGCYEKGTACESIIKLIEESK